MSIPISAYIDITTRVIQSNSGERNFSGLLVSGQTMKTFAGEGEDPFADIRSDYAAGKVVSLDKATFTELFDATTNLYKAGELYFSYSTNGIINLYYSTSTSYKAVYDAITAEFQNFGSLAFIDANVTALGGVAASVGLDGYALMIPVTMSNYEDVAEMYNGNAGVHLYLTDKAYGQAVPMAWYASVNYNAVNASSSIDYKVFGSEDALVNDLPTKQNLDLARVNYIGQVQVHGLSRKFYQTGVNMDGVDLGVFRDSVWIKGAVETGWFDLAGSAQKIPANAKGIGIVRAMLTDVANAGTNNGVILLDKPLTDAKFELVNLEANDASAATQVETSGYYISLKIVEAGGKYTCQYVLLYAKGDHINKVSGTHVLV